MNNKSSIFPSLILLALASTVLSACQSNVNNKQAEAEATTKPNAVKVDDNLLNTSNYQQKLTIIPEKCIGCGRCVAVARDNFAFDSNTRKALVISQNNLNSSLVTSAIKICPTRAISI